MPFHASLEEDVTDRHLEQIADLPLALGAAHVQRHRMHRLRGGLLLQQDPAHLRSVAVGEDHLPPVGRDVGDPLRGLPARPVHLLERVIGAATEQCVAAQCDHDPFHAHPFEDLRAVPPAADEGRDPLAAPCIRTRLSPTRA